MNTNLPMDTNKDYEALVVIRIISIIRILVL